MHCVSAICSTRDRRPASHTPALRGPLKQLTDRGCGVREADGGFAGTTITAASSTAAPSTKPRRAPAQFSGGYIRWRPPVNAGSPSGLFLTHRPRRVQVMNADIRKITGLPEPSGGARLVEAELFRRIRLLLEAGGLSVEGLRLVRTWL